MRVLVWSCVVLLSLVGTQVWAGTLDRVSESKVFKIGYREDAAPFSAKNSIGEPAGYSVDLCRAVALTVKQELGLSDITVEYVPVTAENRFEAIKEGRIDILCGATTMTISRRKLVDFSLPTFIDGASVLFRADGPKDFEGLAGHKVGVRGGTTTEQALRNTLETLSLDAEVVTVGNHEDGLRLLEAGDISAYFADRAILGFLLAGSQSGPSLRLSDRYFTQEPYGLALPLGDGEFRLHVDRTLSRLYRSRAIEGVFVSSFGKAKPSDILRALYVINALPE